MPVTLLVIPARYGSTRFPGKPLVPIRGADGAARPLIEWTWLLGMGVPGIDRAVIATDDARIAEAAAGFGADVVMTPESCRNGTERCAAVLEAVDITPDIIVNLQGDAPLTPPGAIAATVARLSDDPGLAMATPASLCTPGVLAALRADAAAGRVGGTTAVFDGADRALYFSKAMLPHGGGAVHLHMGVYAYRPEALRAYAAAGPAALEESEGLEQLRFLHLGLPVGIARIAAPEWDAIECNNPGDVALIEAVLRARGVT